MSKEGPGIKTEKALGHELTKLGFTDRDITNMGTVLTLSAATREAAHGLRRVHNVESGISQADMDACSLCQPKPKDS